MLTDRDEFRRATTILGLALAVMNLATAEEWGWILATFVLVVVGLRVVWNAMPAALHARASAICLGESLVLKRPWHPMTTGGRFIAGRCKYPCNINPSHGKLICLTIVSSSDIYVFFLCFFLALDS